MSDERDPLREWVETTIDEYCVDNFINNASSIKNDLQMIVDYLWEDEHTSWEELDNPEQHIFIPVNNIKNWLEGQARLEKKQAELMKQQEGE